MAASKLMASAMSRIFRRRSSSLKKSSSSLDAGQDEAVTTESDSKTEGAEDRSCKRPRSPFSSSSSPIQSPAKTRPKKETDELETGPVCWLEELAGRSITSLPAEEIRALTCSGVPMPRSLRRALWSHYFKPRITTTRLQQLQLEVPDDVAGLIDLDVPRSLPYCLSASCHASLRRVLHGLAALKPEVGYCQGLNNVAAMFVLLGFSDTFALSGCLSLLDRCCPDYHVPGLKGFLRDAEYLQDLVKRFLPEETHRRLASLGVPLEVLAAQHFLALGAANGWPASTTAQFWDLLLLDGRPALLASFLALLQLYLPKELSEDSEEPVEVFKTNLQRGVSEDASFLRLTKELTARLPKD